MDYFLEMPSKQNLLQRRLERAICAFKSAPWTNAWCWNAICFTFARPHKKFNLLFTLELGGTTVIGGLTSVFFPPRGPNTEHVVECSSIKQRNHPNAPLLQKKKKIDKLLKLLKAVVRELAATLQSLAASASQPANRTANWANGFSFL